jgi:hypothetical protein
MPSNMDGLLSVKATNSKINVRDPDHCPHAFRDGIKLPMPEQATHKGRHFALGDCQIDQAIAGMTEMTGIKVFITHKKGRAT